MKVAILSLFLLSSGSNALSAPADVFTMETTPCFGTCPVYEVNVFSDGEVIFKGKAHTAFEGIYRLPRDPEMFQTIKQLLDEARFHDFRDVYGWNQGGDENPCKEGWTDYPSTLLSLQFANTYKTVFHYHGCKGFEREGELKSLEESLFELIGLKNYIVTDQTH